MPSDAEKKAQLALIEKRAQAGYPDYHTGTDDIENAMGADIDWLIEEVHRLRAAEKERETGEREWFVVVTDPNGVDAIVGPYASDEEARLSWLRTIRGTRHPEAMASYRRPLVFRERAEPLSVAGEPETTRTEAKPINLIADWIERDRREPDKILCHVASLRRLAIDRELGSGDVIERLREWVDKNDEHGGTTGLSFEAIRTKLSELQEER